jgi:hypothetical protein
MNKHFQVPRSVIWICPSIQQGLRPTIPKGSNPSLSGLLEKCWKQDPKERPDFSEITIILQDILKEVGDFLVHRSITVLLLVSVTKFGRNTWFFGAMTFR